MLRVFGFDRIGVLFSDLYFADPSQGEEGPELGVRLEVRFLERLALRGSAFSARPIAVDEPIWRADLLETEASPGSLNHAHHHSHFEGWEPGDRSFVEDMSTDPVAWVAKRLGDLDGLLDEAGVSRRQVGPTDADELRAAVPTIATELRRMLDRVWSGELAQRPSGGDEFRATAPTIATELRRMLDRAWGGKLAQRPKSASLTTIRAGWL